MRESTRNILKIVVTGPVGAGKTTFIRTISEIEVIDTDRKPTDETAQMKSGTTVAMDFGRITLGDEMWVQIYGTPGQQRFDFMWDLLIQGAHGYVLLVPAHLPGSIREARNIRTFMQQRTNVPFVVGITHADHPDAWDLEDIQMGLEDYQATASYIVLNANERPSVAETLLALLGQLQATMAA
ncbi:ATP/GTP-binding protein [Acaryochloris sp. IP29b_bin.148]|uniref:GTP-binding protein n=1 Tax=Acaryochloris sp. IP29b_bin.148 TaxID=2969218 RepID=UPI00261CC816|nr:ATP/GTP-binding protein [Acaryochloris sp. IP29b_bin.148]